MPGGLAPADPWEGLSEGFRERFWTLGCRGFLVQRSAWCAYLAVVPPGCCSLFLDEMASLGDSAVMADTSVWSGILQLEPMDLTGSVAVAWHRGGAISDPPELPLRGSRWLASGGDSLIANGPWLNSVFLWTLPPGSTPVHGAEWRGTGTELIPVGPGVSVMTCVHSGRGVTPADLAGVAAEPDPWDAQFSALWQDLFEAVDSLIALRYPPGPAPGCLLWLKGSGSGGAMTAWKTVAAPPPPSRARQEIVPPEGLEPMPASAGMPLAEGVSRTSFHCGDATPAEVEVFAGVFERILTRSALPRIPGALAVSVEPAGDSVVVWMVSAEPEAGGIGSGLTALLGPTALCPPESALVANAAVRAFALRGASAARPAPNDMVHVLASVLGLLD